MTQEHLTLATLLAAVLSSLNIVVSGFWTIYGLANRYGFEALEWTVLAQTATNVVYMLFWIAAAWFFWALHALQRRARTDALRAGRPE